jgi:hypothetical protein
MAERAGYTVVVYAIDVSPSMGETSADPATGEQRVKLDLAKEFVARKCEPKVCLHFHVLVDIFRMLIVDLKWTKD